MTAPEASARSADRQLGRLDRALRTADRAVLAGSRALMIAALGAMSVIVFVNVVMRYATRDSLVWAEEVARYLMIWLTFLGVGPVLRLGGHIAVDTLAGSLPPRAARSLRGLILALVALFCLVVAWVGWQYADRTWYQVTAVTEVPFSFVAGAVPVGFGLALWHLVAVARGYVLDAAFEQSEDLGPDQAGAA